MTCRHRILPVVWILSEAAEAIGVTFLMNGGPATVYGARAFAAVQEFYAERSAQPDGLAPPDRVVGG